MKTRTLYTPDLSDFVFDHEKKSILTDNCKTRILYQFLIRFRQEFDTELEFQEMLETVIQKHQIGH
jgi:hypothetical protein